MNAGSMNEGSMNAGSMNAGSMNEGSMNAGSMNEEKQRPDPVSFCGLSFYDLHGLVGQVLETL